MDDWQNKLDAERKGINQIDSKILELLNARGVHAAEIGRIKKNIGKDVNDPSREKELFARLNKMNSELGGAVDDEAVKSIFEAIIVQMKRIQIRD